MASLAGTAIEDWRNGELKEGEGQKITDYGIKVLPAEIREPFAGAELAHLLPRRQSRVARHDLPRSLMRSVHRQCRQSHMGNRQPQCKAPSRSNLKIPAITEVSRW